MIIRKPVASDRQQLLGLCTEFHKKYDREAALSTATLPFSEHKDLDKDLRADLEDLFDENKFIVFVAEDGNALTGFIAGKINEYPEKVLDKEGFIDDWFIREGYRSKGIGRLLYQALIREFKKRGCT